MQHRKLPLAVFHIINATENYCLIATSLASDSEVSSNTLISNSQMLIYLKFLQFKSAYLLSRKSKLAFQAAQRTILSHLYLISE